MESAHSSQRHTLAHCLSIQRLHDPCMASHTILKTYCNLFNAYEECAIYRDAIRGQNFPIMNNRLPFAPRRACSHCLAISFKSETSPRPLEPLHSIQRFKALNKHTETAPRL